MLTRGRAREAERRDHTAALDAFPELWTGRLAMAGFAMGAGCEILTGTTTLRQLGLETPNPDLATLLFAVLGGTTLVATARTLIRLQTGDMTIREFNRYANYFGLSAEKTAAIESMQRKRAGDFTSADRLAAVADAKTEGTLADELLQVPVGQSQPLAAAPSAATAYADMPTMEAIEAAYAKDVEITNGRWAMLGFAALICIEAQTGLGLVGQLEAYAKFMGILGAQSGF